MRIGRGRVGSVAAATIAALAFGSCGDGSSDSAIGKDRTLVHFTMSWKGEYDEAFYYVRLRKRDGHREPTGVSGPNFADGSQAGGELGTIGKGPYELVAYARECEGECPSSGHGADLGPPIDRCDLLFEASGQEVLDAEIVITPDRECEIRALRLA